MNIASLSQELNISLSELRRKLREAGFRVSPKARKVDNRLAKEIIEKLKPKPKVVAQPIPLTKEITIPGVLAVRDLALALEQPVTAVIKSLIKNGVMASMNEQIDFDAASVVAGEFGYEVREEKAVVSEIGTVAEIIAAEPVEQLVVRPPIVAVMGHVDHGKTKLLDTIRSANVSETEAGAITQHIGAYKVVYKDQQVVFLDTPGHEAFAAMRARGANVTDLIVLVVAADDGVKQQTLEVVNRAKLSKTPMIVAINKIDRAEANPDLVKSQLAEVGVVPEEWGGKTIFVPISAKTKTGVDKLLDMILLSSEVENYRANPAGMTVATVIESNLSKTQGPIASVIVQNGTLRVGDIVAVGSAYGKVRSMEDHNGKSVKAAGPSTPVRLAGLSGLPEVGDLLRSYTDIKLAQADSKKLLLKRHAKRLAYKTGIAADIENQALNLIIKADVQGSLEAILQEFQKLENQDVKIQIVAQGVGEINESDVLAAESARATVIGFHNTVSPAAARLAKQKKVNIDIYEIIYELTEDITQAILSLVLPEVEEVLVGEAKLLAIFRTEREYTIAGGTVLSGQLLAERKVILLRDGVKFGDGKILELQRTKQPAKSIPAGSEFGIRIATKAKLQKGDLVRLVDEHLKEKKLKKLS